MDLKSAARLRLIGILVVLAALSLLWLPMMVGEKLQYSDPIAGTIAIGIGLLLIAEIGPAIRTLKAGGVEVELVDTVSGKFNTLESRVAALELAARHPEQSAAEIKKRHEARPSALAKPPTVKNDPQKGRWGGLAERDGFILSAEFQNVGKSSVEVILTVKAPNREGIATADCVEFHLHNTFNPDVVPAIFDEGVARLSLIAYGGFTVGVWIGCTETELELDLSQIKGAPRIIRDL